MLTFAQYLEEENTGGIVLLRNPDGHTLKFGDPRHNRAARETTTASWKIHHPVHGHLGDVHLESNPRHGRKRGLGAYDKEYGHEGALPPIHKARSATMSINTVENPNVPASEVGKRTIVGPQYKIGPAATRHIFRHVKKELPNLRRIENSQRVTGARSKVRVKPGNDAYDDKFRYPVFKLKKEDPKKNSTQQRFDFHQAGEN